MRIGLNLAQKTTAGFFYNKHVLWNKPTLKASIDDTNKRFKHLNVKMKK